MTRRPRSVATLLALAMLMPLAAAAQTPETTRVEIPAAGFAVELPSDWQVVDVGAGPAAAEAFSAAQPELADHVAAFLATGPMATMAIEPSRPDDAFPATFASFSGPNMGMSAESMLQLTLGALPMMPGVSGEPTSEQMVLDGQPAFAVGYDWELRLPDGTAKPAHVEQFTVMSDDTVWVFSVTDDTPSPDGWRALAATFDLLG